MGGGEHQAHYSTNTENFIFCGSIISKQTTLTYKRPPRICKRSSKLLKCQNLPQNMHIYTYSSYNPFIIINYMAVMFVNSSLYWCYKPIYFHLAYFFNLTVYVSSLCCWVYSVIWKCIYVYICITATMPKVSYCSSFNNNYVILIYNAQVIIYNPIFRVKMYQLTMSGSHSYIICQVYTLVNIQLLFNLNLASYCLLINKHVYWMLYNNNYSNIYPLHILK